MLHFNRLQPRLLIVLVLSGSMGLTQETRGGIFGHVTDPSFAAVTGAQVTVKDVLTNVSTVVKANDQGYFDAPLLLAGTYQISAEAPGFRKEQQNGVVLPVGERLEVNFKLQVGALSETVTVTGAAPVINADNLTTGTNRDSISIQNLPWPGSNAVVLAQLTPGVQDTDSITDTSVRLHSGGPGIRAIAYGGVGGNDYSVDGSTTNANTRGNAYNPAPELIEAMTIGTSMFDASQGHSTGIVIALQTKAGTNDYHGTMRETFHDYKWDALDFFTKQAYDNEINAAVGAGNTAQAAALRKSSALSPGRENNYAATFGGPVRIPKVINGKNKLFFFIGFAGFRDGEYRNAIDAFPTAAMRTGDFSSLLNITSATGVSQSAAYQIYDPLSTVADPANPGHVVRTPFPGNIVPQSYIVNPMYKFMAGYLPLPNATIATGSQPNLDYNAFGEIYTEHYYQIANRFDYNVSSNDRLFFSWNLNTWQNHSCSWECDQVPISIANFNQPGAGDNRHDSGERANWVHVFGPRTLLNVTVGSNRYHDFSPSPGTGNYPPSTFGLPSYMDQHIAEDGVAANYQVLPTESWSGWTGFSGGGGAVLRFRTLSAKTDLTHSMGKHSVKIGFDARGQFYSGVTPGAVAGSFSYSSTYTQESDNTTSLGTGSYGGAWASFMMGLPSSISAVTNTSQEYGNPYYGAYIQDSWRISSRLTLNFGLRGEYEFGPTDRYNRLIGPFDPTATLAITAQAEAAYAQNPLPQLPASQFQVLGGATFPGVNGVSRRLWDNTLHAEPRLGAAYQIGSNMVVRAGYGLYYDTLNVQDQYGSMNQLGYSWTTTSTLTNNFGQTWLLGNPAAGISPMTNPFPVLSNGSRFEAPPGATLGAMAPVGLGYTFAPFDRPHARQNRWRLDVQRQFGSTMVLNVGYAGTYSDHLPINQSLSALPPQYWSYGNTINTAVANMLNTNVPNPYNIANFASLATADPLLYQKMAATSFFTSTTIHESALLSPYSQMNGLTETVPKEKSKTEELDITFDRRFFKGFNANIAYTRMDAYNADYFPNTFDTQPAWEPSNTSRPNRLVFSTVYQIPFGKGRRYFTSGPGSWFLGGFQVTVLGQYQPGALLTWPSTAYYSGPSLASICNSGPHTLAEWFNTADFQTNPSLVATTGQARVFPNEIDGNGGCRGDSLKVANASAQRDFRFREKATFQFRFDVYNITNHSEFGLPNTTPTSAQFGQITTTIAGGGGSPTLNRSAQVAGRLSW